MSPFFRWLTRMETQLWLWLLALSGITLGGIGSLVQGLDYNLLIVVTVGGLLLGRILARIRSPWWLSVGVIMGSGFEVSLILVGHILPLFFNLVGVIFIYLLILWGWGINALPAAGPLWAAVNNLGQGSGVVLTRLWTWLVTPDKVSLHDPLPAQLVWGWLLLIAAAWAAYLVWQNRQALLAVAPLGVLLTITTFFTGVAPSILSFFLGLALVLQTMSSWRRRQQRWLTYNIDTASDLALDVATAAVVLIGIIVILSLVIPQISPSKLLEKLRFQQQLAANGQHIDNMAAALGIERRVPLPTQSPRLALPEGLPRRHLLGSGPQLTEQLVMLIKTNDPPPLMPLEHGGQPPPAHYWWGATFDLYTGRGWINSPTTELRLEANQTQLSPEGPGRIVTQTVQLFNTASNLLFTAGAPMQVNQPGEITFRSNRDWVGTTLESSGVYTAQSWLPQPNPDKLRQAGTNYPEWLSQRYLALSDDVPTRVRALALQLTATAATPYDRAITIEAYLRQIPYSLEVPLPPDSQDVVDYFLFDLKKGFCDYYATSMVVLARAAGLPARFVIGYAPSPYDFYSQQYVVREMEAHSWAQIYFPDYGWIDFEPTGGRAPINRAANGRVELPTLPPNFDLNQAIRANQSWWYTIPLWQLLLVGLGVMGSAAAVGIALRWWFDRRLARLPVDRLVPLLQGRLEQNARWLGMSLPGGATPLEFEARFFHHLERLAAQRPMVQKIAPVPADISRVVNTFMRLRYAPQRAAPADALACLDAWRRLRWRLWGTLVVKTVRRLK